MHKLYNFLQSIFNQTLFTKDIKMPNIEARVCQINDLLEFKAVIVKV